MPACVPMSARPHSGSPHDDLHRSSSDKIALSPPGGGSLTIDDVNGSRVRPRTSHRLRMRDIHVIYADSNSADFAGFKNRLLLKWSQCKHSKKGTVRRDWNDVDNHQDCKRIGQTKIDPSLSDPAGQQCIFLR